MRYLLVLSMMLALGACGVSTDDNGFHQQAARSKELHNTGPMGGIAAANMGACNADTITGCGGLVDRAEYQRLASDGKLRFTYPGGEVREYAPAGSVTIGPITTK